MHSLGKRAWRTTRERGGEAVGSTRGSARDSRRTRTWGNGEIDGSRSITVEPQNASCIPPADLVLVFLREIETGDAVHHLVEATDHVRVVRARAYVIHTGEIERRPHRASGAGWLVARFYVRRRSERLVLRHMNDLKERVEAVVGDRGN